MGSSGGSGSSEHARQCNPTADGEKAEYPYSEWTVDKLQNLADLVELIQLGEKVVLPRGLTPTEARSLLDA